MIKIKIDNFEFLVKPDISVLEACKYVGIHIPRFCYHEILSVAGNCRMCLVEIEKSPKPVASCALPVLNNMQIFVNTPLVKKARENVLETLLLNHPLDCPICDQAGECDLQDQTKLFGGDYSRFFFNKRGVEDKECGPLIKTIMTRCIHCTRCVRFGMEIAGVEYLGTLNRGGSTEIGGYISSMFNSEISGNVIDLCPVGALTSKPYAFKARPWEIRVNESIDLTDSTGSNIYVNFKESEIIRILPKSNLELNETIISDKARFSYDAVKNQRLLKIFKNSKSGTKNFSSINWKDIFAEIDTIIQNKKNILIIADKELDLESLSILKKINNTFKNKIQVRLLNHYGFENSFNGEYVVNKINEIKSLSKFCFLFSSNLRLESAIINTKIRTKYLDQNIDIFSCGSNFKSNFPLEFVNLNFSNLLKIIEGKMLNLSKLFVTAKSPLVIIGDNLNKRFSRINSLISFIKKIMPTAIVLNLKESCNSSGVELLSLKGLGKNDLLKSDVIFAVNLDDNILVRTILKQTNNKETFWLNTHGSQIGAEANYILPTTTSFESEGIFFNLESKPQKCLKTLAGVGEMRSTSVIFNSIKNEYNSSKFLDYVYELVEKTKYFSNVKNILLRGSLFNSGQISAVSLYPGKIIEDFYSKGKFTKNSAVMLQCSQEVRKTSVNF